MSSHIELTEAEIKRHDGDSYLKWGSGGDMFIGKIAS